MLDVRDGVALILLDQPPVNSLGHALRAHLDAQLDAALAAPQVRAIVLQGNDKFFSAGADVSEFGTPRQTLEPILPTLLTRIQDSPKPVVAALAGMALGGGFELALACHARVALPGARVGLPEITLGLIPGAGGTQRLPRLLPLEQAYGLMHEGRPVAAATLADSGLFAAVVDQDLIATACTTALALAQAGAPLPSAAAKTLLADTVTVFVTAQRERLNARQRLQPAYGALLDALEGLSQPLAQGLQKERECFVALVPTTAAQALRYQFKAEREAAKLPAAQRAEPRALDTVAVIGAGTMGAGIAIALLDARLDVILLEQNAEALARGAQRVQDHYAGRVAASKMTQDDASARQARLRTTLDWAALAQADLVIEAVFEDLQVKQEVFRKIDASARAGAVLATNTSYLDVDAIAGATQRPQDVLGLHFFSPANVMKLLEVVRATHTAPDVMATGMALGGRLGKVAIPTGNAFGFIGNRIYNAYRRQCEFMLEDGAWPEQVDEALTSMGFAMGPFAVADLSGLDIAWRMRQAQAPQRDPRERYVDILDRLCEMGRLGRKTGAGYYSYPDGKQVRTTEPVVRELIEQASARRGVVRQPLSRDEIRRRVLLAMANEAALLLAEGVAARPSDIDVALVQGYGFPRWEGGPVFWATRQDRRQLEHDLQALVSAGGHGYRQGNPDFLFPSER